MGFAWDEGDVEIAPGLFTIPFWVLLPKKSEATNLLVVAAPSASHIGMSTLRMEPQFMMIGHAAGTALALARRAASSAVQDIDVGKLRMALLAEGMIVDLPPHELLV